MEDFTEKSPSKPVLNFLEVCGCCDRTVLVSINKRYIQKGNLLEFLFSPRMKPIKSCVSKPILTSSRLRGTGGSEDENVEVLRFLYGFLLGPHGQFF